MLPYHPVYDPGRTSVWFTEVTTAQTESDSSVYEVLCPEQPPISSKWPWSLASPSKTPWKEWSCAFELEGGSTPRQCSVSMQTVGFHRPWHAKSNSKQHSLLNTGRESPRLSSWPWDNKQGFDCELFLWEPQTSLVPVNKINRGTCRCCADENSSRSPCCYSLLQDYVTLKDTYVYWGLARHWKPWIDPHNNFLLPLEFKAVLSHNYVVLKTVMLQICPGLVNTSGIQ